MLNLCSKHCRQVNRDQKTTNNTWGKLLSQGIYAHNKRDHKTAQQLFSRAEALATLQLNICQQSPQSTNLWHGFSTVDMLVIASHNLSAALCAQKRTIDAEHCLKKLHRLVSQLCVNPLIGRELRLDALANLDRSLLSLTSVLGSLGLIESIQTTIKNTEVTADMAARQLFH
jgi:hypothetical protein